MPPSESSSSAPSRVSCPLLFWTFFRIGLMTFGGGFAMAAVVRHELVLKRHWLTKEEFVNALSAASAVPGAIAVNLAFVQGQRLRGLRGAFVAAVGTISPSVLVILLVVRFVAPYFDDPYVNAFLQGCAIGVAGQIGFATYTFARHLRPHWKNGAVCAVGLLVVGIGLHPVWAVVTAAALGYVMMRNPMMRIPGEGKDQDQQEQ